MEEQQLHEQQVRDMKCYGDVLRRTRYNVTLNPKVTLASSTKRHTRCLAIYK